MARRGGQQAVAFDLFGDVDLHRSAARVVTRPSLTLLVDAAMREPPGDVIYGAGLENHPALVGRLAERHVLLGNGPATLRAVRDPFELARALRDHPVPRISAAAPTGPGPWLRKPLRGGGGVRVRPWRSGAPRAGTFVQERIDGIPCSAVAVGDGAGAVVVGLTEQLVGRRAFGVRGYRWCGNLVPPRLPASELLPQARAICSRVAEAFGLRGLFGVDFVWDAGRAWTLEVNPRPTASVEAVEAAYGVDAFAAHLRGCAGELPPAATAPARAAGKAVLFATEDVIAGDLARLTLRDVPHHGERIARGRPVCTVVASAATPDDVLTALEEQAGRVRAELRVEVPAGG